MQFKIEKMHLSNSDGLGVYEFELPALSKPMSVFIANKFMKPLFTYLANLDATKNEKWRLWVFYSGDVIDIPAAAEFLGYIHGSSMTAIFVMKCS